MSAINEQDLQRLFVSGDWVSAHDGRAALADPSGQPRGGRALTKDPDLQIGRLYGILDGSSGGDRERGVC